MSDKWSDEEDAAIIPLLRWPGTDSEIGREGVMMLSGAGYKRSQNAVVHRLRKLREDEQQELNRD